MSHYDLVICGGGLTGLLLANLLKDSNFTIAVIDAGSAPGAFTSESSEANDSSFKSGYAPRVSALNSLSVELIERTGAFAGLERFAEFSKMHIKDGEGIGEIQFSAADIGRDRLGIVVENHLVIAALYAQLQSADRIDLRYESELDDLERLDDRTELDLVGQGTLSCELLIAADGGNSRVRELSGVKSLGWSYDQTALVTTLMLEEPHGNIPRQWFTESGPLAFLPLADPNLVSIVWSHQDADDLKELTPKSFCQQIHMASEGELGQVVATDARYTFPLRQYHATRYTRAGLALIGDAAHTIHPLAGQGANLGFGDAAALAAEIRQTIFSDHGLADAWLLKNYALKRQPHNLAIAAGMETIKQLYSRQNPALSLLRSGAMRLLDENKILKNLMIRMATDGVLD